MSGSTESRAFVAGLVAEMQQVFARLGARETLEAESQESGGPLEVKTLLKLALKSELEASEMAGFWMPTTPEVDAKLALAEQCFEEMNHYRLISERLRELGEDVEGWNPVAEGYSPLYQYLRGLRTTVERIAAGPFAREAIAEVHNAQFIAFCHAAGDAATAGLYERIIHPQEIAHHRVGRELLEKYCVTPQLQEAAANAARTTLAIADELSSLAEKSTGMHHIPVS